jgi:hypothetical protein
MISEHVLTCLQLIPFLHHSPIPSCLSICCLSSQPVQTLPGVLKQVTYFSDTNGDVGKVNSQPFWSSSAQVQVASLCEPSWHHITPGEGSCQKLSSVTSEEKVLFSTSEYVVAHSVTLCTHPTCVVLCGCSLKSMHSHARHTSYLVLVDCAYFVSTYSFLYVAFISLDFCSQVICLRLNIRPY